MSSNQDIEKVASSAPVPPTPTASEKPDAQNAPDAQNEPPYSIFTRPQKRSIIILVSFMGIISPLSSAVYLPAVPDISADLHVSPSVVNLTITAYMVRRAHLQLALTVRSYKELRLRSSAHSPTRTADARPMSSAASSTWPPTSASRSTRRTRASSSYDVSSHVVVLRR